MNIIDITDRKWLCQHRNGDTFATNPTTDYVSYFQILVAEKTKLVQTIEVSTVVEASTDVLIKAESNKTLIKFTHPYNSWATEGISVGDTLFIEANGVNTSETVESVQGNLMYTTNTAFFSALGVSDGLERSDYVFRVTTVPTALNFEFGIIPNIQNTNSYNSLLNGEPQFYTVSDLVISVAKQMTYISNPSTDLGSVEATYTGSSGTGSSVFSFTIEHIFRMPPFVETWLSNYLAGTIPAKAFQGNNSYRYASKISFLTNPNNPNNAKIIEDGYLLGSVGFQGQNFNNGGAQYVLDTIDNTDYNVKSTNTINATVEWLSASFASGVKAYLYVFKLPSQTEIDVLSNTFETNFVWDQLDVLEAAGTSSSTIINNFQANINGGNPRKLDLQFDLDWNAAGVTDSLNDGDNIAVSVIIENGSLDAPISNRMPILLYSGPVNKSSDTLGITDNQLNFYPASSDIALTSPVTGLNTWNNTAYIMSGSFRTIKESGSTNHALKSLEYRIVGRIPNTETFFDIDKYKFPFTSKLSFVDVGGGKYQTISINTNRPLGNTPDNSEIRKVNLFTTIPAVFQNYQEFTFQLGFEIPHRTWIENLAAALIAPQFYDSAEENDNFNQRTSNYSDELTYDIFVFVTAVTSYNGVDTIHHLSSDESLVADFDVDVIGTGYSQVTQFFDLNGDQINTAYSGEDVEVVVTITKPSGTLLNIAGEMVFEYTGEVGQTSRLSSFVDWQSDQNALKPLAGSDYVVVAQPSLTTVTLTCRIKGEFIINNKPFNVYGHLVTNT